MADRTAPGRRNKHAVRSQNIFRAVVRKAESHGMRVNTSKMKLLVVLDALSFSAFASIVGEDGKTVHSGQSMKILGFHMDGRPPWGPMSRLEEAFPPALLDSLPPQKIWLL